MDPPGGEVEEDPTSTSRRIETWKSVFYIYIMYRLTTKSRRLSGDFKPLENVSLTRMPKYSKVLG